MKTILRISIIFFTFTSWVSFFASAQNQDDIHYRLLENYRSSDSRKEISLPVLDGYITLKGDFHMHTYFSDGEVTPQTRVIEAWREGLDVISITDHSTPIPSHLDADYNTSYEKAKSTARRRGITLIHATEYTQSEPYGHLNFLFIDDANIYAKPAEELHPGKAIEMANEEGAVVILNHPGWPDKNSTFDPFHLKLMENKMIHAVEVFNSSEFYPLAIDYSNELGLTMFSNTDIHSTMGLGYDLSKDIRNLTIIFATENTPEAIKDAFMEGRTLAYAQNYLAGRPELLYPFLKNSVRVTRIQKDENGFYCHLTNDSDITWQLEAPDHEYIVLPAKRTIRMGGTLQELIRVYNVTNTYTASNEHLQIPLNFFVTSKNQVQMPFIAENTVSIEPGSTIYAQNPDESAKIRYTLDGSEPSENSLLYQDGIQVEKSGLVKLRAFSDGLQPSETFTAQVILDMDHEGEKVRRAKNGVRFDYYEGAFLSVFELDSKGKKVDEGTMEYPVITNAPTEDHFGYIFSGYIYAPETGLYDFGLISDDGSVLQISGIEIVNNDGSHSRKREDGSIRLKKGYHPFELRYFEDYAGQSFQIVWATPGEDETIIGREYFFIEE